MIVDAPVLVIGRKGQLATDLVAVATDEHAPVIALGRPDFDLMDADAARRALDRYRPGAVINAAAYTAVDRAESEGEAAFSLNRDGAARLAAACAAAAIPFLHVSTDQVFDGSKAGAYVEDDVTGPLCVYGQSKLAGEIAVLEANPSALVARTSWVFGPSGDNFVTKVLGWARASQNGAGQNLRIVGDQRGCPTYSPDLAFCLLTLAQAMAVGGDNAPVGILHLAGPEAMTRDEQARRILAGSAARRGPFAGVTPVPTRDFPTRDFPTPATRPLNAELDTGRLKAVYGLQLQPFGEALAATLDRLLGPVKIG